MRVAVVGTGISGLVAARGLAADHDLVVYEAGDHVGGHTHTHAVEHLGRTWNVDTGFIVFNERTYPGLIELFSELGVEWQESDMSFSVRCERTGLEYNGTSLNALFAQRTNLLRPSFWRMVRDILRFYGEASELLEEDGDGTTLGDYLTRKGFSAAFVDRHIVPMAAAVWSARPEGVLDFPAKYLVRFFDNHGFLQVDDRPRWLVVRGGSKSYVEPLIAPFRDTIRLRTPVVRIERGFDGVRVTTRGGAEERFDRVVLACHADQALRMLADPTALEREVLGAFAYQENDAVLHTDTTLLPRRALARASWNYHLPPRPAERATVTYWMDLLQGFEERPGFCVTLNHTDAIDPARILRRMTYHHPVYTPEAVRAQARHAEVDGTLGTYYCGAYWGFGFHEDGLQSARRLLAHFEREAVA